MSDYEERLGIIFEEEDMISGGKSDGMSLEQIYKKHKKAGWKGTLADLEKEYKMGIKVEMEHTSDQKLSAEISRDHLEEFPDYYTRLDKMEKAAKSKDDDDEGRSLTDDDKKKLRSFVRKTDGIDDTKFHAFTKKLGVDNHKAEAYVYTLAQGILKKDKK